jgi:hypothetical protein
MGNTRSGQEDEERMRDSIPPRHGNPDPRSQEGPEDGTLGGYLRMHARPPAFQASDGHPYTVSAETEEAGKGPTSWAAYLVFPRWARTGVGIVGHLESPVLFREPSRSSARGRLEALTLAEVRELLEEALHRDRDEAEGC